MLQPAISIVGTGIYLPGEPISSEQLDCKLNRPVGSVEKKSGVRQRHYAGKETTSQLGAKAAMQAVKNANISLSEIDCIISCGAVPEQVVPSTSALIQRELNLGESGITCFDVNMTCLGFIAALDVAAHLLTLKRHKKILIVSSEIPSIALNWDDMETCTIFGDGAAAVIVTHGAQDGGRILSYETATYGMAADACEYRGTGTRDHPSRNMENVTQNQLFRMQGKQLVKLVARYAPNIIETALAKANVTRDEIALCLSHQASNLGMKLTPKLMKLPAEKIMNIYPDRGNQVSASIPSALHEAVVSNRIKRGDKIIISGTAAGVSIAVMVLEY